MSDQPVKVVFDTTAALKYPSVGVGELIREVADEGGVFGLPVVCLAQASLQAGTQSAQVRLLSAHEHCEVLALLPSDWELLAKWMRLLGRVDCATAMLAARANRAYLATAEPDMYDDGSDDWDLPIIGI